MAGGRKRRRVVVIAATLVILPAAYALSYAPVLRGHSGPDRDRPATMGPLTGDLSFYQPVEWLIDNTSAKRPLMWWASVWGVNTETEDRAFARSLQPKP